MAPRRTTEDKNIPTERAGPPTADSSGVQADTGPPAPHAMLRAPTDLASHSARTWVNSDPHALATSSGAQSRPQEGGSPLQSSQAWEAALSPGPLPGNGQARHTLRRKGKDAQPLARARCVFTRPSAVQHLLLTKPPTEGTRTPPGQGRRSKCQVPTFLAVRPWSESGGHVLSPVASLHRHYLLMAG